MPERDEGGGMAILTLRFGNKTIQKYHLEKAKILTIGRLDNNDIAIKDPIVSGQHAQIASEGDSFFLTDRQSRNGTFVNKQLVISRKLKHGDVITIGKHTMLFTYQEGEIRPYDTEDEMIRRTMAVDTSQHRGKLARSVSKIVSQAHARETIGVITFLAGGKEVLRLSKPSTTIGKSPSSDIVVQGFWVGKTAAIIKKKPEGYYLSYVDGKSKPKVNYKTVRTEVGLNEFDVIEVGSAKMQFHFQSKKA